MARKQTVLSVGIYEDTEKLLDQAVSQSGNLRASVLRTAIKLGLKQILDMHEQNGMSIES